MSQPFYGMLADAVVVTHAAFVLFVAAGQLLILLGWRRVWGWTRNAYFRWAHLCGIGFVVVEAWLQAVCPLTLLENRLRALAGGERYEMSFVGYWIGRLLYYSAPEWVFTLIYTVFGLLVAVTFVAYPPRRRAGK